MMMAAMHPGRLMWYVYLLSCVYHPIALAMFSYRSHMEPISLRLPRLALTANTFSSLWCIWFALLQSILYEPLTYAQSVIPLMVLQSLTLDAYLLLSLTLYITYNHQLSAIKITHSSAAEIRHKSLRWIHLMKYLRTRRFVFGFMIVSVLMVLIPQLVIVWLHPVVNSFRNDKDARYWKNLLLDIGVYKTLWNAVIVAIVAFRLRLVEDAFGTKKTLKRIGIFFGIGFGSFILIGPYVSTLVDGTWALDRAISWLTFHVVFFVGTVVPVLETYTRSVTTGPRRSTGAALNAGEHTLLFEAFLRSEQGFKEFQAHLVRECSVESLLFWRDATVFAETFGSVDDINDRSDEINKQAWIIYDQYLAENAVLELNLPAKIFLKLREEVFVRPTAMPGAIAPAASRIEDVAVFKHALRHVVTLMMHDSLHRFKQNDRCRQLYGEFVMQQQMTYNIPEFSSPSKQQHQRHQASAASITSSTPNMT